MKYKKQRIFQNRTSFYRITIALIVFFLLFCLLQPPHEHYIIHSGAVNPGTGTVCIIGEYSGKSVLYLYASDGQSIGSFCFFDTASREQFNRIWFENGYFNLYCFEYESIYLIDDSGNIVDIEKLETEDFWKTKEKWINWNRVKNVYSYELNGITYEYNDSNYFALKLNIENREFSITDPKGNKRVLWSSSERDNDKKFEEMNYVETMENTSVPDEKLTPENTIHIIQKNISSRFDINEVYSINLLNKEYLKK